MTRKLRLAILISGRGTNMEAILKAAEAEDYPATPALVLSNTPGADGLYTARRAGIATIAIDHKPFGKDREAFERHIDAALRDANVDIIALAGFMRILTPWFVQRWAGRLVNIHPSLLPKYPGLKTHQRAIDAGDSHAGCSVHWVTEGVDAGKVIARAKVQIRDDDTAETLAARILPEEHRLYPVALAKACKTLAAR
jgi:formyltetrahydrofolate-dependent phosphoribosylglycinamide formyltransferase